MIKGEAMKRSIVLVLLTLVALVGWCSIPTEEKRGQVEHSSLDNIQIFAYRDWQSSGVHVQENDLLTIKAEGTWLYTPGEYHGPEGHRRYASPPFYPLPGVPGGALIGRIGEGGPPFYVGKQVRWQAHEAGLLYLRIDDDILSDNEGYVTVAVETSSAEE
jgi:hypothetical protein